MEHLECSLPCGRFLDLQANIRLCWKSLHGENSNLFGPFVNYKEKKFCGYDPQLKAQLLDRNKKFLDENTPTYFSGESVRTVRQTFVEADLCRGGPL
jgi:hypothetical protein